MWPWRLACVSYDIWFELPYKLGRSSWKAEIQMNMLRCPAIILCCQLLRKSEKVEPTHLHCSYKEMSVDHIYIDVIDVHQKCDSVHSMTSCFATSSVLVALSKSSAGCWSQSGWNRVIVEKPFGKNGVLAQQVWKLFVLFSPRKVKDWFYWEYNTRRLRQ